MVEYKIYQAKHLPTGKVYIGLTKVELLKRIGQHLALTAYKRNTFQKFYHTTKYEEWAWEVLYATSDREQALKLELDTIHDLLSRNVDVLNNTGVTGKTPDPSGWLRDHQYVKGQKPWNTGKTNIYSPETIQKMRMAKLRKPTFNPPSPETIQKIQTLQGKAIVCIETGEEFPSIGSASAKLNLARSGIRKVLNGKAGHVGGYTFKFKDKETNG